MSGISVPGSVAMGAGADQGMARKHGLWSYIWPSHITGIAGAVVGYLAGYWLVATLAGTAVYHRDQALLVGFLGLTIGWLAGVGTFTLPFQWVLGKAEPNSSHEQARLTYADEGWWRYFRFTIDHKVVGIQYLALILVTLSVGGILAMLMRADLMFPGSRLFGTDTYNTLISMHGMLMIVTMFTAIVGPFGNYFVPLLIGARDVAFPRLNALSWHLAVAGVAIFLFQPFLGGTQTGWAFYAPLSVQAAPGADAFAFGVLMIMLSSALGAVNIITTIITMRAPGLTWTRLPVFVWGVLGSTILTATATTAVNADFIEVMLDRAWRTTFFLNTAPALAGAPVTGGGQAYLSEVLFWFFGHPEVYLMALPGFAVVLEIVPVFSRKPLFTYGLSVIGIMGVAAISFLVWGHHLFVSGWQQELRGYYMGTTKLISIPTGFVFLGILGTLWRGNLWMTVSMGWALAFLWTFLIGGITGLYLADVPADIQLHGNYFVVAHFHYVILGSSLWGFFAAIYYWFPKMTGRFLDERLGWIHFWTVQIFFNLTFGVFFWLGLEGLPRRVADYAPKYQLGMTLASIFAFCMGGAMLIFFANVVWSRFYGEKAGPNPWRAKTLEWQTSTPVPIQNSDTIPVVTSWFYGYGVPGTNREPAPAEPDPLVVP